MNGFVLQMNLWLKKAGIEKTDYSQKCFNFLFKYWFKEDPYYWLEICKSEHRDLVPLFTQLMENPTKLNEILDIYIVGAIDRDVQEGLCEPAGGYSIKYKDGRQLSFKPEYFN